MTTTKAAIFTVVLALVVLMAVPHDGGGGVSPVGVVVVAAADDDNTTKVSPTARVNHPILDKMHAERRFLVYNSRMVEGSCSKYLTILTGVL